MTQGVKGSSYESTGKRRKGRPAGTKKMPSSGYSPTAKRTLAQAQAQSRERSAESKKNISKHVTLRREMKPGPTQEVSLKKPASKGGAVTRANATKESRTANRKRGAKTRQ
jgi:hypothetical protein